MGRGKSNMGSGSSASTAWADSSTQSFHRSQIAKLAGDEYEQATYDLGTMQKVEYPNGYQVTFCQIGDNYSDEEYASKVNEFLAVSSDGKASAGKYGGVPEVSFHCDSVDTAVALGVKYNQVAVYDWENQCDIFTGGTGERK